MENALATIKLYNRQSSGKAVTTILSYHKCGKSIACFENVFGIN